MPTVSLSRNAGLCGLCLLLVLAACLPDREIVTPESVHPSSDIAAAVSSVESAGILLVSTTSAQASSNRITLTRPSAVQDGDLLVAQVSWVGGAKISGPPLGWTSVREDFNGEHASSFVYWKRAGVGEPSSFTWTLNGSTQIAAGIAAYRHVAQTGDPVDTHAGHYTGATTSIVAPSIETTVNGTLLIGLFTAAGNPKETGPLLSTPSAMIARYSISSQKNGNFRNVAVLHASSPFGMAGATGTRTSNLASPRPGWGQLIALRPEPTSPPVATTVEVIPSGYTFTAAEQTLQFTAAAYDATGKTIEAQFSWSSSAEEIVTITDAGLAKAHKNGAAVITASTGDVSGSASVSVVIVAPIPPAPVSWVWSGGQTSGGAMVKARLVEASTDVRLRVSADSSFLSFQESISLISGGNHVVTFMVSNLSPETRYHYRVVVNGLDDAATQGSFRTLPMTGTARSFSFALGSCQRTDSNKPVFDQIRKSSPLFWLQVGDIHYRNISSNNVGLFRDAYNHLHTHSYQAALYRSTAIVHIWDDHDGGGGNDTDGRARAWPAARAAYRENVPHHPLALGADGSIYHSFVVGRVRFIVADLRSERSPKADADDSAKTMLGAAQKQYFKNELAAAKANGQFVFWVSTIPWIAAQTAGADHWGGYSTERAELAGYINSIGIGSQMLVLTGDMHATAIDSGVNNAWGGFPLFNAGPVDQSSSKKGGPYSHGPFTNGTEGEQFGLVTVTDTGGSSITVSFSGRRNEMQITGAYHQFSLTLSQPASPP